MLYDVILEETILDGASVLTTSFGPKTLKILLDVEGIRLDAEEGTSPACDGEGVPAAAEYVSGPGIHPTVLLHDQTDGLELPEEWIPEDHTAAELVACFDYEHFLIQNCFYTGGKTIELRGEKLVINLVAVQTGTVVATNTFTKYGSCWASVPAGQRDIKVHVSSEEIFAWLQPFIEQP